MALNRQAGVWKPGTVKGGKCFRTDGRAFVAFGQAPRLELAAARVEKALDQILTAA